MRFTIHWGDDHKHVVEVPDGEFVEVEWDGGGYVHVLPNGALSVPFRAVRSDEPFVFVMDGKDQRIAASEDSPPFPEATVVWRADGVGSEEVRA